MAASEQTQRWLMHACTNDYPSENITDNSGWPSGMMGQKRAEKLQAKGIHNFKQLMQQATSMTEPAFKAEFGGRDGALDNAANAFWEVLNTWHQAQCAKLGHKIPQTDEWLIWADTHPVPAESLEKREGWPSGMLGEIRVAKLASQGITKTSQLMHYARSMKEDEFVKMFGGHGGALDNRAAAYYGFLNRFAAPNPQPTSNSNFMLIAIVLIVLAIAYKFVA